MRNQRKRRSMGYNEPLILNVATPEYKQVVVETRDGNRYYSDLSPMSFVYCFPKTKSDWDRVKIADYHAALEWDCKFEVHIDQIVDLAYKTERYTRPAA